MMKKLILSLLLGTVALPMTAVDITVDNLKRNYIVYAPRNLGENRPLLISCHGMNQDANYQKGMLKIETVADTAKFLTVFPNGIDKGWDISGDRDIRFVLALIDEMVTKYKIDRNRVYLSGFSMGGMFTYHAMNRIADRIAAFAPISGYPMWGATADAKVRPLPLIHTHGTSDDVVNFGGVQGALNAWIRHNGCPTTPRVVSRYRNAAHITRRTWGPGNQGVEVVLLEMAGKGHWISNDNGVLTGDEIWRFCSRYSLDMREPSVQLTAPVQGLTYVTLGGASEVPPVTLKATAGDPNGRVVSVAFYDGKQLLQTLTREPFEYTVRDLGKGTHELRAVATDDEGLTGSAQVDIAVEEPTRNYLIHSVFNTDGSVPQGWATGDGSEQRAGFSSGYTTGSRLFHFTGEAHDFEWGLYTRNVDGSHRAGYARYADPATLTTLTLYPGNYQLYYKVCNWNQPDFSPVTVSVATAEGQEAFSHTFVPTVNVGNAADQSFSGTAMLTSTFDISSKDRYTITFYTADAPWADLVVGQAAIRYMGAATGAGAVTAAAAPLSAPRYYSLSGQRLQQPQKGLYIVETAGADGRRQVRVVSAK